MKIVSTECSKEQQEKDRLELQRIHSKACEEDVTWEFFGGTITLPNGNQYQVMED